MNYLYPWTLKARRDKSIIMICNDVIGSFFSYVQMPIWWQFHLLWELTNVVYSILHLYQGTSTYKEEKGWNDWTLNRDYGRCHHFYWHWIGWPWNYSLFPGSSIPSNCNHRRCLWFGIAWFFLRLIKSMAYMFTYSKGNFWFCYC